jgi:hypothetical protein
MIARSGVDEEVSHISRGLQDLISPEQQFNTAIKELWILTNVRQELLSRWSPGIFPRLVYRRQLLKNVKLK